MKKVYLSESNIKTLSKLHEKVLFQDYFDGIKSFLKDLLDKPSEAKVGELFKSHGYNTDEIIKKLKNVGLLKSKENIIEVPIDEATEKGEIKGKQRAKHTIVYSIPRNRFMDKIHELYKELFAESYDASNPLPKVVFKDTDKMIQDIKDMDYDGAYSTRGGYRELNENSQDEISSKYIQRAIMNKFSDDNYLNPNERDKRIRDMRYKATEKYDDEHPYFLSGLDNSHKDNEWLEEYSSCPLKIVDDDYKTLEDLYNGVKSGRLLIHCREMQGIEDGLSCIYPEAGETVKFAYGADYAECDMEIPELVFASDNFNWAHDTRNGIYFVESDNFQRSLGDGRVQFPNGEISDYYIDDMPLTVESGDWYSDEVAYVVAYMDISKKNMNESILRKAKNLRINENLDEHPYYDYICDYDETYVYYNFMNNPKKNTIFLPLINPSEYQKALDEFTQYGELVRFPSKKVYQWMGIVMKNTALLRAMTSIGGHSSYFDVDAFVDAFFGGNFEEFEAYAREHGEEADFGGAWTYLEEMGYDEWSVLPDGSDAVSDYGIAPLEKIISEYDKNKTAEETLVIINKAIDVVHCRGDLSSMFINGGSAVLDRIADPHVYRPL